MQSREGQPAGNESSSHAPSSSEGDLLARAYAERTKQLHDARGALAEAVSALSAELAQHREEATALREERHRSVGETQALRQEVQAQRERIDALEEALRNSRQLIAVLQNMKVMRWSAPLRRIVYRLRARGG